MSAVNQGGWRPTPPESGEAKPATFTGNHALMLEEPLIFEIGSTESSGVDCASAAVDGARFGGLYREAPIGLPGLSEPETVRHYTRLSRQNYAIDLGVFPLGSCTMKHNPRLNEKVARMPGFADIHPLQPVDTVQGALELIAELGQWLVKLTGMHSVAMSPKAGAHGELCGLLAIRSALEARGDKREVILVPESAHGTNPATAAFAGYRVESIPADPRGRVDLAALKARLGPDVAGLMITNPNTCGLFEPDMIEISRAVHDSGGLVYCDGANFNAIVGRVRPGDLGIDAMHINLHKTFSTPHGGGGPGSGPVVFSEALTPFAPLPFVEKQGDHYVLVEEETAGEHHGASFGRMVAFHGQMGMFTRALSYMMSHGADGLRQVAEDSVLNANYVLRSLEDVLEAPFGASGPCMHEALFSDRGFAGGLSTLDLAKGLIDEGYHPMTMYFPLVVHGAMLVEPTETESKAALDQFIGALRSVAERAKAGDQSLKAAPVHAPRRRLDETQAARRPVLVSRAGEGASRAAESASGARSTREEGDMGRGCTLVLPAFAIAGVAGYVVGWILFGAAPPPESSMEGTSGIQIMFFDAPAVALAAAGAAAVVAGIMAVVRKRLAGANSLGVGLVLAIPAFIAVYYGMFASHQLLLAHRLVPAPADPFFISRTVAPIAAGVAAAALMLWMLLRRAEEE